MSADDSGAGLCAGESTPPSVPTALAVLEDAPGGRSWRVVACPFCAQPHVHGAGPADVDPRALLGGRLSHCADGGKSYVLVDGRPVAATEPAATPATTPRRTAPEVQPAGVARPEDRILVRLSRGPTTEVRIVASAYRGVPVIGLRLWWLDREGTWRPTRKGLALKPEELELVRAALGELAAPAPLPSSTAAPSAAEVPS